MNPIHSDASAHPHSSISQRPAPLDLGAIKARQQTTWASGDFGRIGVLLQIVGETLCEAVDVRAGERVLDVAAGNGNASLAAARRYADVFATDYVPEWLADAARRAEAERLPLVTRVADVENLPFADREFDVVLSTFGVMFAPNQERAAGEILRVVRPGGRIGLANWTPDGFIGELFRVIGRFVPPPAGLRSPALWGTEAHLAELFGAQTKQLHIQRRQFVFRNLSPDHWIEVFRHYYGPVLKAFEVLDGEPRAIFRSALLELLERHNRGGANSLVVPSDYLEVVVQRA